MADQSEANAKVTDYVYANCFANENTNSAAASSLKFNIKDKKNDFWISGRREYRRRHGYDLGYLSWLLSGPSRESEIPIC